ncbi:MAG: hypothetical protein ABSC76_12785 [Terracidiphilus sp.]
MSEDAEDDDSGAEAHVYLSAIYGTTDRTAEKDPFAPSTLKSYLSGG